MSRPPTYARKVDSSHRAIVKAFEFAGASVAAIQSPRAGLPDLAIGVSGSTHLVEVKPDTKLKAHALKPAQVDFAAKWRGGVVHLVRSPQQAWELVALLRMSAATRTKAAIALANRVAPSTGLQESIVVGGNGPGINFGKPLADSDDGARTTPISKRGANGGGVKLAALADSGTFKRCLKCSEWGGWPDDLCSKHTAYPIPKASADEVAT